MTEMAGDVKRMIERLKTAREDDHERGCQMRYAMCSCGFDDACARTAGEAAEMLAAWNQRDTSELERGIRLGIEAAARLMQNRMDCRFEEHGTREWDTNACYYQGPAAETYETLDEEAEEAIAAILALDPAAIVKGLDHG